MRRFGFLFAVWSLCITLVLADATRASAQEPLSVQAVLARTVIDPGLPLAEAQRYTESRVPPMPEVQTVEQWEQHAERMRRDALEQVIFRGVAQEWRTAETGVVWEESISGGPGYKIRKLRYEALPGLWLPALLYEPDKLEGKVPLVLNVNGHDRTDGKAAPYKQIRCINQAKRGMLALNVEWLGMGQLNSPNFDHYKMNQLDLCGTSGIAPFYLAMSRAIDLLLKHEHADPDRLAVSGLSGGGWQTIFISAFDTRVKLCDPVAGYSSFRTRARNFSDLGDSEQTPSDLGTVTDYAQMTAMLAPRPALLSFNAADNCCFKADHALPPLLEAARPIYGLYGQRDRLRAHVNFEPGTHNFDTDNREALYRMLGEFFDPENADFDAREIPSDSEVKTKAELTVPLPADNADFHSLAMALSQSLPRDAKIPKQKDDLEAWRQERRPQLKKLVHAHDWQAQLTHSEPLNAGLVSARTLQFQIGGEWTVPGVELTPAEVNDTVIVVADAGRESLTETVEALLAINQRVIAIDPFYFGESKISRRDFLFGLLVAGVGERPLGIQASQLAAVARWCKHEYPAQGVRIVTQGPRSSLYALVAAAIETKAIGSLVTHDAFDSLREIITENMGVNQAPELFCFGLLERFDIPQISALVAKPVQVVKAGRKVAQ